MAKPSESQTPPAASLVTRAAHGAVLLSARSVAIRLVGLASTIVVARVLVPEEFGILALGLTLTAVIGFAGSIGLGAGLIRRPEEPDRLDLQTVMTVTAAVTALSVPVLCGLIPFSGETVGVAAVMVAALPIQALRTPGTIVLERHMNYGPVARVEIAESLVGAFLSVGLVLLGAGVWGVAASSPARAIAGTALMWRIGPVGPLPFAVSRRRVRKLLGEGSTFAAQDVVGLVREHGINVSISGLGGLGALGAWALQGRLMLIPGVVLTSLWQVAFPAMSRASAMAGDSDTQVKRALGLTAVGLGLPLAALIGSSQTMVPVLFGPGWEAAAETLPFTAASVLFGGPSSVALGSKLFADNRGRVVVFSAVLHTALLLALIFALYETYGLPAVGIAACGAGLVEVIVFSAAVRGDSFGFLLAAARPTAATALGGLAGLTLGQTLDTNIFSVFLEVAVSGCVAVLAMCILARPALADFFDVLHDAVASRRR